MILLGLAELERQGQSHQFKFRIETAGVMLVVEPIEY